MKQLRTVFIGLFLLAMLCLSGLAVADGYKPEYKLSSVLGKPFPWGIAAERWAQLVTERTQGRITVRVFPGAALVGGNQSSEFSALRQGAIDFAVGGGSNWSPQVKELNLFSLPFLIPDHKALDILLTGEVGADLFRIIESKGAMPLAWGENGFRELSNSKRQVRTPEDLKGLKIRVTGSPLFTDAFTAMGANPTQMSWADAQPAFSTGAVDGQENSLTIFQSAKLHTVGQTHLTLWGYVASVLIFAVNKDIWQSWTPADREIVKAAALQAARENIELARKGVEAPDDSLVKEIESNGVRVVKLSASEKAVFRKATQSVYDKWSKIIGETLVNKAEAAVGGRPAKQ